MLPPDESARAPAAGVRPASRAWAMRGAAILLGFVFALTLVEAALRVPRLPWPLQFYNYVTSCYESDSPSPIWYCDPRLEIRWPRPHVETRCGAYHRIWHHRSDQLGHRNPEDWSRVDVALLGDSMVYGQGVEESETAAHALRDRLGRRVANLGQTGACPVEYLMQVRSVVPDLHPRVVVVFLYRNDVQDVRRARTPEQLRRFIATGEGSEAEAHPAEFLRESEAAPAETSGAVRAASHSYAYRALRFGWLSYVTHAPIETFRPDLKGERNDALGREYIRVAVGAMSASLRASGSTMVLAYMPTNAPAKSGAERMGRLMREEVDGLAAELRVPHFDGTDALSKADGTPDPDAYLPDDSHLSPSGHRRLAEALARFLTQEHLLD
jgi:hypothetical protein